MNRKDGDPFISQAQGYVSEPKRLFFIVIL
nr:MAG TPA: hypothetical protein [Bacteriophage sp.]